MTITRRLQKALRAVKQVFSLKDDPQWLTSYEDNNTGVDVNEETALRTAAYFGCQRIISEDLAKIPLKLLLAQGKNISEARTHPVFKLLHIQPNPWQTPFQFRRTWIAHAVGTGNGYGWIEWNRAGRPKALWNLRPDRVRVERDDVTREPVYYVRTGQSSQELPLRSWEVLHLPGLGWDGCTGYNPVQLAAQSLGVAISAEKMAGALYGNGLNASGTLEHPGQLSEEAIKRLRESIEQRNKGMKNAMRLLIIEEGMKFSKQTLSPEEAQFLESRNFGVVDICRWWRVHPRKLYANMGDSQTYANVEQVNIEHVTDTLMPHAVSAEQELDVKLLSESERERFYTKHNFSALMRGDFKTRQEGYEIALRNKYLVINEVREMEERNPVEWGDDPNWNPADQPPPAPNTGTAPKTRMIDPVQVLTPALRDVAIRNAARESKAVSRIAQRFAAGAGRLNDLQNELCEFYSEHRKWLESVLHPVVEVANQVQEARADTPLLASAWINASSSRIFDAIRGAAHCPPTVIASEIEQVATGLPEVAKRVDCTAAFDWLVRTVPEAT